MRMLIAALLCVMAASQANAQVVEGIGYFKTVIDNTEGGHRSVNPIGAYPENYSINLRALTVTQNRHTVYAAATLTSEVAPSKVIFIFQRIVDPKDRRCAGERDQDFRVSGDVSAIKRPDNTQEKLSKVARLERWLSDRVGSDELGIGNVKLKVVSTEPGQRTYYDYRFVACAGKVRVWVVDPQLNLLTPEDENRGIALRVNY